MVKYANRGKPKKSKRMTLQQKYKIERKIKEHHKKSRRAARKMQQSGMKKKAKMDVIPNLYPFKADIIKAQQQEKLAQQQNRGKKKIAQMEVENAEQLPVIHIKHGAKQFEDYTDLIEVSDVVVEVLDARDPQSSRNQDIEREIISSGKKLVLLVTKTDLIPAEQANKWRTHLNTQHPTILFSSVQNIQGSIKNLVDNVEGLGLNKEITVGFIGYPLMGKSTLINQLINNTHYNKPYRTKEKVDLHQISNTVFISDTFGVINAANSNSLLFNSEMDHKELIAMIVKQIDKTFLREFYQIPAFKKSEDFLEKVAKASGKLLKGGIPNLHAAAKQVINDLRDNKLTYYTHTPS